MQRQSSVFGLRSAGHHVNKEGRPQKMAVSSSFCAVFRHSTFYRYHQLLQPVELTGVWYRYCNVLGDSWAWWAGLATA
jgi:hypothetical protein